MLLDNRGFASIGALSESLGSQRFGTRYRTATPRPAHGRASLPVDFAANAASLGAHVRARHDRRLRGGAARSRRAPRTTVIQVETDPLVGAPGYETWWDVPVAEVAELDTTRAAREQYEQHKRTQKQHLSPARESRAERARAG